ncbi:MAG: tetratricopeptide repeat protein [Gammaproteobacteria bacterium]|nr:tetratricopeptide repeat protein [Gammaproteobacteria bacterium]MBQ0838868.1 tetratricopeptide repeat protein [Gammaproteobacteria bacterium]
MAAQLDSAPYVGAQVCGGCHQQQHQQWQKSDHFKAMQVAKSDSVLGDFSGITVSFHDIDSRFYRDKNRYYVATIDGVGKKSTFEIKYTFGFQPLQQYLIETKDGHIQALNTAWDSRSKEEGGQRWFHLQPDENISPEHPFFWTRHFQNWNNRCASCHSTHVEKNYDAEAHSYNTTWSEINVSCEACHGSGAKHVELAKNKQLVDNNSGFASSPLPAMSWQFKPGESIASPQGNKNTQQINMCGSCHALRTPLVEKTEGADFHDANRLQLLNEGSYFLDGQIREEAFVMGSFLQSKMHGKGVTCSNCHNPHSGKVLIEGNGLCAQCHKPEVFDTPKHHHHPAASTGAACVNCHMPARTFMQVDDRRDHSFTIPRPDLSQTLGVPNACTNCHADQADKGGNTWASEQLSKWGVKPSANHWANLNQRAQAGDVLVTRALTQLVDESKSPDIIRASLLQQVSAFPSRVSVATAQKSLQDDSPMLRRGAIRSLQALPAQTRWKLLLPYLNDNSRSVRYQLAETLADTFTQLQAEQQAVLAPLLQEYLSSLQVSADSPATQSTIGGLELSFGNVVAAEKAYQQALRIEPHYVPALLNMADLYRGTGREAQAADLLKRALKMTPDSGAVQHSYALLLIRKGDYQAALPHLKLAIEQTDAQARYAYVYAVALDELGQTAAAVQALVAATKRWPNQYDLLMTLVFYLEKSANTSSIYTYISQLTAIAPADPAVKKLVEKYLH